MDKKNDLYGLVLVGGHSKRMASDKYKLEYHGVPQVTFVVKLLEQFCAKVLVSLREDQSEDDVFQKCSLIFDKSQYKNIGPLGGMMSAMSEHKCKNFLVLACDLPFVDDMVLKDLISQRDQNVFATAFKSQYNNLPEPLCAIYESSCFDCFEEKLKIGMTCPRKLLMGDDVNLIDLKRLGSLDNVNTFQEFLDVKNNMNML